MTRTLLIAAALATTLGAATLGGAGPALADHDGCYNCGPGYGYNDNDWRYNPPNQQRWADYLAALKNAGQSREPKRG